MRTSLAAIVTTTVATLATLATVTPADAATTVAGGRVTIGRHGVVLSSSLPHCASEDGSGGATPCTWNVGARKDGNGSGVAYIVTGAPHHQHFRYVWGHRPVASFRVGYRWVGTGLADALTESGLPGATSRDWAQCLVHYGDTTYVKCADGFRTTS
jgi:hypothetical protein